MYFNKYYHPEAAYFYLSLIGRVSFLEFVLGDYEYI